MRLTRQVDQPDQPALGELVARASADELDHKGRVAALAAIIPVLAHSAKAAGVRAVAAGRWMTDVVIDVAPHIPVRDARTLRAHLPGRTDDEIAAHLVRTAARVTAALGAAAGGLAAVEFAAPPALLAVPVQLAAEMVAITAVEVKLVAELHEIFGQPAQGSFVDRSQAYLLAWAGRRVVGVGAGTASVTALLGHGAKRELRSALLRRLGRSATSLAPFLAGAVAGAAVNRRATAALGERLLSELRGESTVLRRIRGQLPGR